MEKFVFPARFHVHTVLFPKEFVDVHRPSQVGFGQSSYTRLTSAYRVRGTDTEPPDRAHRPIGHGGGQVPQSLTRVGGASGVVRGGDHTAVAGQRGVWDVSPPGFDAGPLGAEPAGVRSGLGSQPHVLGEGRGRTPEPWNVPHVSRGPTPPAGPRRGSTARTSYSPSGRIRAANEPLAVSARSRIPTRP